MLRVQTRPLTTLLLVVALVEFGASARSDRFFTSDFHPDEEFDFAPVAPLKKLKPEEFDFAKFDFKLSPPSWDPPTEDHDFKNLDNLLRKSKSRKDRSSRSRREPFTGAGSSSRGT